MLADQYFFSIRNSLRITTTNDSRIRKHWRLKKKIIIINYLSIVINSIEDELSLSLFNGKTVNRKFFFKKTFCFYYRKVI